MNTAAAATLTPQQLHHLPGWRMQIDRSQLLDRLKPSNPDDPVRTTQEANVIKNAGNERVASGIIDSASHHMPRFCFVYWKTSRARLRRFPAEVGPEAHPPNHLNLVWGGY